MDNTERAQTLVTCDTRHRTQTNITNKNTTQETLTLYITMMNPGDCEAQVVPVSNRTPVVLLIESSSVNILSMVEDKLSTSQGKGQFSFEIWIFRNVQPLVVIY